MPGRLRKLFDSAIFQETLGAVLVESDFSKNRLQWYEY
jgi:hypothetical protein